MRRRAGSRFHAQVPPAAWERVKRIVWARDRNVCWFCGERVRPASLRTAHHVIFLEHGGAPLDPGNIVCAHKSCHKYFHAQERRARTSPEQAEWQRYLDSL